MERARNARRLVGTYGVVVAAFGPIVLVPAGGFAQAAPAEGAPAAPGDAPASEAPAAADSGAQPSSETPPPSSDAASPTEGATTGVSAVAEDASSVAGEVGAAPPPEPAEPAAAPAPPKYVPLLEFKPSGMVLSFPLSVAGTGETVGGFPVDATGTRYEHDPMLNTRLRVGARWSSEMELVPIRLVVTGEADVLSGRFLGGAAPVGPFTPYDDDPDEADLPPDQIVALTAQRPGFENADFENEDDDLDTKLRKASLQLDVGYHIHLMGGIMTSHWGMGLVANDGAHGWTPGSALFADPRGGDRTLRGMLVLGAFTDLKLAVVVAVDRILDEPVLTDDDSTAPGDEASGGIASIVLGFQELDNVGVYGVMRTIEAPDGRETVVRAIDIAGAKRFAVGYGSLAFEAEGAAIWGSTEFAPSIYFAEHDVLQLAAAARVVLDTAYLGYALDFVYASGDGSFDDLQQNAFKADVNFPLGLIAHRYVVAAQSARGVVGASDPTLTGYPVENLDRIPTRGAVTNTVAVFPRGLYRPMRELELFAGPLFMFTVEPLLDPFRTRLAGGGARNALDGESGSYLGTELDIGLRYRRLLGTTEATFGLEGGLFLPGSALHDMAGETMESVAAGRLTLGYKF
jgi:hypothetical protein